MKKRVFVLLLLVILVFAACGHKNEGPNNVGVETQTLAPTQSMDMPEKNENSGISGDETDVQKDIYQDEIKVFGQEIYCDYLKGRIQERMMSSYVFYAPTNGNETDTVMLVVDYEKQYEGDLEGVIDFYNDGTLFLDLGLYYGTGFNNILEEGEEGWFIEVDSTTPVTIKENNLETCQFTGHVINDENVSCYLYGYSFVKNELAFMLMGIVHSPGQEKEIIEKIKNEVDAMIITIRDE